jgi:hypothetical protein
MDLLWRLHAAMRDRKEPLLILGVCHLVDVPN